MTLYTVALFHIRGTTILRINYIMSFLLGIISLCLCLLFHRFSDHLLMKDNIWQVQLTEKIIEKLFKPNVPDHIILNVRIFRSVAL